MTRITKIQLQISYQEIISLENLFAAWQEFLPGKKKKKDAQEFGSRLADNILQLHEELANFIYVHGPYKAFNISDPKPRNIHKASVRDRVLHHAIYRQLYPFFDRTFIADSYSCRNGKGLHKALNRFREFGREVGKNNTRTVWVLKCDIRKFFASIDHVKLLEILESHIQDKNIIWLLRRVIESFSSNQLSVIASPSATEGAAIFFLDKIASSSSQSPGLLAMTNKRCGLPLGNLTSQLFCNIYMNEFDQFVKHHRVLRNTTGRRMFKRIYKCPKNQSLQSYLGMISHGNSYKQRQVLLNWYGLFADKYLEENA